MGICRECGHFFSSVRIAKEKFDSEEHVFKLTSEHLEGVFSKKWETKTGRSEERAGVGDGEDSQWIQQKQIEKEGREREREREKRERERNTHGRRKGERIERVCSTIVSEKGKERERGERKWSKEELTNW